MSSVTSRLPEGVKTELGPDATALGWVFQYALVDTSGKHSLSDLRAYQDWYLSYYLRSVPGVAEVAPVGGYTRQFQVNLDPNRLRAYGIPVSRVVEAVRAGNNETSGRLLEFGGTEYMVRGRGYARTLEDFANIPLSVSESGSQIRIKDVGQVVLGPDLRRGLTDLDGNGEVVSGIVVMRNGENALEVIDRVKSKIKEIAPGLPAGVKTGAHLRPLGIDSSIDRHGKADYFRGGDHGCSDHHRFPMAFSQRGYSHYHHAHRRAARVHSLSAARDQRQHHVAGWRGHCVQRTGGCFYRGCRTDAQEARKLGEEWDAWRDRRAVVISAIKEVAGPTFFALLVIAVSFLPVLTLQAQEGRMFRPLAYTKTLTMLVAAVLAITLDPALRILLTRANRFDFQPQWLCRMANAVLIGKIRPEEEHPLSRRLIRMYEPVGPLDPPLEMARSRVSRGSTHRSRFPCSLAGLGVHAAAR